MEEKQKTHYCLNCQRSENEIPLVNLTYSGRQEWVCSQCLPLLIHHIEKLKDKLDADKK